MATETAGVVYTVIRTLYQAMEYLKSLNNPDPASIRELYNRLNSVEFDIRILESAVANLSYEVRRGQVIELTRDIDAQRAGFLASLIFSADHPGDSASEITALSSCLALSQPSFYTFPGSFVGSPDRFDPRATLPSFVEAVSVWLAIRRHNGTAWTDASRETLFSFATTLEGMVSRIRGSVSAFERYISYDEVVENRILEPIGPDDPPPPPPHTRPRCGHDIFLIDSMLGIMIYFLREDTAGHCSRPGERSDPARAKSYLDSSLQPDNLATIAATWRQMAA